MLLDTIKFLPGEIWANPDSKPYLIALAVLIAMLITSITLRKVVR